MKPLPTRGKKIWMIHTRWRTVGCQETIDPKQELPPRPRWLRISGASWVYSGPEWIKPNTGSFSSPQWRGWDEGCSVWLLFARFRSGHMTFLSKIFPFANISCRSGQDRKLQDSDHSEVKRLFSGQEGVLHFDASVWKATFVAFHVCYYVSTWSRWCFIGHFISKLLHDNDKWQNVKLLNLFKVSIIELSFLFNKRQKEKKIRVFRPDKNLLPPPTLNKWSDQQRFIPVLVHMSVASDTS